MLLPIVYVLAMLWAWLHRAALRVKLRSGRFGLFSLWFPLLTTLVAAWADFGLALIAPAVSGVLWALFRRAVAYTGPPRLIADRAPATPAWRRTRSGPGG